MVKSKLSKKQKISSSKEVLPNEQVWEKRIPMEFILNEENLAEALVTCIEENDLEGLVEIIDIYLITCQRAQLIQKTSNTAQILDKSINFFAKHNYQELTKLFEQQNQPNIKSS